MGFVSHLLRRCTEGDPKLQGPWPTKDYEAWLFSGLCRAAIRRKSPQSSLFKKTSAVGSKFLGCSGAWSVARASATLPIVHDGVEKPS